VHWARLGRTARLEVPWRVRPGRPCLLRVLPGTEREMPVRRRRPVGVAALSVRLLRPLLTPVGRLLPAAGRPGSFTGPARGLSSRASRASRATRATLAVIRRLRPGGIRASRGWPRGNGGVVRDGGRVSRAHPRGALRAGTRACRARPPGSPAARPDRGTRAGGTGRGVLEALPWATAGGGRVARHLAGWPRHPGGPSARRARHAALGAGARSVGGQVGGAWACVAARARGAGEAVARVNRVGLGRHEWRVRVVVVGVASLGRAPARGRPPGGIRVVSIRVGGRRAPALRAPAGPAAWTFHPAPPPTLGRTPLLGLCAPQ